MNEADTLEQLISDLESGKRTPRAAVIEAYRFGQDVGLRMAHGAFPTSGISVGGSTVYAGDPPGQLQGVGGRPAA